MSLDEFKIKRCCRKAGGIFVGLRVDFPVSLCKPDFYFHWTSLPVCIGLIFWTISFQLTWNHRFEHPEGPESY